MLKDIQIHKRIREFEKRINTNLPNSYKSLLKGNQLNNLNNKSFNFIDIENNKNISTIQSFYSFTEGDDDIELNYFYYLNASRIPALAIPIAKDIGGDLICISLQKASYGKIYYWDHELELESPMISVNELACISNEIKSFINMLSEYTNEN